MRKIKIWLKSLFSSEFLLMTTCDNLYAMYRGQIKTYSFDDIIKKKPKTKDEEELHYAILKSFLGNINKKL